MSRPKVEITLAYRVLDPKRRVLYVGHGTGTNKYLLRWRLERFVEKRFGKTAKLHVYKTTFKPVEK